MVARMTCIMQALHKNTRIYTQAPVYLLMPLLPCPILTTKLDSLTISRLRWVQGLGRRPTDFEGLASETVNP